MTKQVAPACQVFSLDHIWRRVLDFPPVKMLRLVCVPECNRQLTDNDPQQHLILTWHTSPCMFLPRAISSVFPLPPFRAGGLQWSNGCFLAFSQPKWSRAQASSFLLLLLLLLQPPRPLPPPRVWRRFNARTTCSLKSGTQGETPGG